MSPCINNLVVTLVISNESHVIVHHNLVNLFVTTLNKLFFLFRDNDIAQVERQTSLISHLVTQVLDSIQEFTSTSYTDSLNNIANDVTQRLLRNNGI